MCRVFSSVLLTLSKMIAKHGTINHLEKLFLFALWLGTALNTKRQVFQSNRIGWHKESSKLVVSFWRSYRNAFFYSFYSYREINSIEFQSFSTPFPFEARTSIRWNQWVKTNQLNFSQRLSEFKSFAHSQSVRWRNCKLKYLHRT